MFKLKKPKKIEKIDLGKEDSIESSPEISSVSEATVEQPIKPKTKKVRDPEL